MHPLVYFAHDKLEPAELCAARLDGHLVELGEAYIPADAVETPALRAASLRLILRDTLAATHLTAAWVHGAIASPPPRLDGQRAVPRRIPHVLDHRLRYRDVRVEPGHLHRIGGVLVTTPSRTLADLTREFVLREPDPHVLGAIAALSREEGAAREAIVVLALHGGAPGKRRAIELLRRIERDHDDVTRYTS